MSALPHLQEDYYCLGNECVLNIDDYFFWFWMRWTVKFGAFCLGNELMGCGATKEEKKKKRKERKRKKEKVSPCTPFKKNKRKINKRKKKKRRNP